MARTPQKKGPYREGKPSRTAAPPTPSAWQPEPVKKVAAVAPPVEETPAPVAEPVAPAVEVAVAAEVEVAVAAEAEVAVAPEEEVAVAPEPPAKVTPERTPLEPIRVFETVLNIPMPMPMEVVMGKLTNEMKKLHDQIVSARSQRHQLLADGRKAAEARHQSVNEMMSSFRQSRTEAFRQAQTERSKFLSGLRNHVHTLQREMSADLAGAGRAFRGA